MAHVAAHVLVRGQGGEGELIFEKSTTKTYISSLCIPLTIFGKLEFMHCINATEETRETSDVALC